MNAPPAIVFVASLLAAGCTYHGAEVSRTEGDAAALRGEVEGAADVFVAAGHHALVLDPKPSEHAVFARDVTGRALELSPPAPADAQAGRELAAATFSDDPAARAAAAARLVAMDAANSDLVKRLADAESRATDAQRQANELLGKLEAERNRSISSRIWQAVGWLGVLAVVIAACCLFPPILVISGQLLRGIVGHFPSMAKWAGVVSRDAFDAVVEGVRNLREEIGTDNDELIRRPINRRGELVKKQVDAARLRLRDKTFISPRPA